MAQRETTRWISAGNVFSDPVEISGQFNLSLSGTWVATVVVQRSFDQGVTWKTVGQFTAVGEFVGSEPEADILYKVGVETGFYTSGTVIARLSQ